MCAIKIENLPDMTVDELDEIVEALDEVEAGMLAAAKIGLDTSGMDVRDVQGLRTVTLRMIEDLQELERKDMDRQYKIDCL